MRTMKAAVFIEPGRIGLDEKPIPSVGPGVDDGWWHGHRTVLVDGSGGSMPDTPAPKTYSANRRSHGRGAASPWHTSWGSSMPTYTPSCRTPHDADYACNPYVVAAHFPVTRSAMV
jgi:hypothetical protein